MADGAYVDPTESRYASPPPAPSNETSTASMTPTPPSSAALVVFLVFLALFLSGILTACVAYRIAEAGKSKKAKGTDGHVKVRPGDKGWFVQMAKSAKSEAAVDVDRAARYSGVQTLKAPLGASLAVEVTRRKKLHASSSTHDASALISEIMAWESDLARFPKPETSSASLFHPDNRAALRFTTDADFTPTMRTIASLLQSEPARERERHSLDYSDLIGVRPEAFGFAGASVHGGSSIAFTGARWSGGTGERCVRADEEWSSGRLAPGSGHIKYFEVLVAVVGRGDPASVVRRQREDVRVWTQSGVVETVNRAVLELTVNDVELQALEEGRARIGPTGVARAPNAADDDDVAITVGFARPPYPPFILPGRYATSFSFVSTSTGAYLSTSLSSTSLTPMARKPPRQGDTVGVGVCEGGWWATVNGEVVGWVAFDETGVKYDVEGFTPAVGCDGISQLLVTGGTWNGLEGEMVGTVWDGSGLDEFAPKAFQGADGEADAPPQWTAVDCVHVYDEIAVVAA